LPANLAAVTIRARRVQNGHFTSNSGHFSRDRPFPRVGQLRRDCGKTLAIVCHHQVLK
jgi:hypothetical protein